MASPTRDSQWQAHTASYLLIGEKHRLSYNKVRKLTGLSRRAQTEYRSVLVKGGMISVQPRRGVVFLVGKGDRRSMLKDLPYPTDRDPPAFKLL